MTCAHTNLVHKVLGVGVGEALGAGDDALQIAFVELGDEVEVLERLGLGWAGQNVDQLHHVLVLPQMAQKLVEERKRENREKRVRGVRRW